MARLQVPVITAQVAEDAVPVTLEAQDDLQSVVTGRDGAAEDGDRLLVGKSTTFVRAIVLDCTVEHDQGFRQPKRARHLVVEGDIGTGARRPTRKNGVRKERQTNMAPSNSVLQLVDACLEVAQTDGVRSSVHRLIVARARGGTHRGRARRERCRSWRDGNGGGPRSAGSRRRRHGRGAGRQGHGSGRRGRRDDRTAEAARSRGSCGLRRRGGLRQPRRGVQGYEQGERGTERARNAGKTDLQESSSLRVDRLRVRRLRVRRLNVGSRTPSHPGTLSQRQAHAPEAKSVLDRPPEG